VDGESAPGQRRCETPDGPQAERSARQPHRTTTPVLELHGVRNRRAGVAKRPVSLLESLSTGLRNLGTQVEDVNQC
jgi:hypothetical protein